jgi:hypothetical protein
MRLFMYGVKWCARFWSSFIRLEEGQMAPFVFSGLLIAYSLFMGAAIDMSNLWLHKYRVSTAAQAACESGAADLIWVANLGTAQAITTYEAAPTGFPLAVPTGAGSYTDPPQGTSLSGSCSPSSPIAMCAYATANMPGAQGLNVSWIVSNITPTPPTYNANGAGGVSSFTSLMNTPSTPPETANGVLPYLRVNVSETVPTYLLSVMPWFHSPITVAGNATAGLVGTSATGPELTLTGACPYDEFVYDPSAWEVAGAAPRQIRTTGSNFGSGESTYYVFFNCNDSWVDQSGVAHPWNYVSTLPGVVIDDVAMRQYVGNQETGAAYAVVSSVVLVSSPAPFTLQACAFMPGAYGWPGAPSIPGLIDWGATDYLVQSVDESALYLYDEDTNRSYSPWVTSPDPTNEPYEPADWFYGTGPGSITYLTPGVDSAALVSALSDNRYFGFGWCIQGNGKRDFIGYGSTAPDGGDLNPGTMTIYYHLGGTLKVSLLSVS